MPPTGPFNRSFNPPQTPPPQTPSPPLPPKPGLWPLPGAGSPGRRVPGWCASPSHRRPHRAPPGRTAAAPPLSSIRGGWRGRRVADVRSCKKGEPGPRCCNQSFCCRDNGTAPQSFCTVLPMGIKTCIGRIALGMLNGCLSCWACKMGCTACPPGMLITLGASAQ